jgi:hypothetical protein
MRLLINANPSGFLFRLLSRLFGLRRKPAPLELVQPVPPPVMPGKIRLIVGLDFGTYSTKILLRQSGEKTARVVLIDQPVSEYPPIVAPSLVRLAGGKIFFGGDAHSLVEGRLYRYLKKELLPGTSWNRNGPDPDVLVAAYLTWALGQTKQFCDYQYGAEAYDIVLQLAAPMANLGHPGLKSRYLKIAGAAWMAVFEEDMGDIVLGEPAKPLLDLMESLLAKHHAPVGQIQLFPETIAPIVSLARNDKLHDGIYLVVDMGSGTTEFSVNEVLKAENRVVCYFDQSIELGDGQFRDAALLDSRLEELLRELRRTWRKGFEAASASGADCTHWKSLRVLLAGGGAQRAAVRGAIERDRRNVMYPWPAVSDTRYSVDVHWPSGIDHSGVGEKALYKYSFLLAVAHGLSFERHEWPVVFR